ncbi:A/G-specific adenine glycosylase [Sphingomonas piscis]|nr:A/G-specific adenine glycosylase [Sphingomonas piscis]
MKHYLGTARTLPWRAAPGTNAPDPYRVWLSEVMLQQTTVTTVTPRFNRFIERWPTIEDLAAASDKSILSEWAGLGYYARARNLIACAREIAARGSLPNTAEELRKLPGVGEYTSAAVAAIAFGERVLPVDTNIRRVAARLFAMEQPTDSQVRDVMTPLIPTDRAGDFAQALMDLGATICRPAKPLCSRCPLAPDCTAFALGQPELFPRPKARKHRPHRHGTAWWTRRGDHLWLVRRPDHGILGGMAALPGPDWTDTPHPHGPALARIRHVFTHFSLDLDLVSASEPVGDGWWHPVDDIDSAGLPTLYLKAARAALATPLFDAAA